MTGVLVVLGTAYLVAACCFLAGFVGAMLRDRRARSVGVPLPLAIAVGVLAALFWPAAVIARGARR